MGRINNKLLNSTQNLISEHTHTQYPKPNTTCKQLKKNKK